jgi:hypothetical protein
MERLPEMFGVIRLDYRHMYISLCKNTFGTKKRKASFVAPAATTQRYSLIDVDCNILEYLPTHGDYDALVREESANSSHQKCVTEVGWKRRDDRQPYVSEWEYYCLPFVLYYDGDRYPIIDFICHRQYLCRTEGDYKFLLTEWDKHAIQYFNPERYDLSQLIEGYKDEDKDDEKEPEPVPNKLPTFVIENHMHCEIARSECPIASIGLNECDRVSMLDCYHVFDSASIHAWMRIKAECPVCKGKSQIIHTLSVPESLRPPAPAPMIEPAPPAPKKLPKPGIAPAAPKKLPKPGIAPSPPK